MNRGATLARAAPDATPADRADSRAAGGAGPFDVDLRGLAAALRGPGGIGIADRWHRLRRHSACFLGREAVDWIVRRHGCTRAQAVRIGQRLVAHGIVQHVAHEHDFEDSALYYRFAPEPRGARVAFELPEPVYRELVRDLRGPDGIRFATHYHWLVRYPNCVVGSQVVDWIVAHTGVTREQALDVGQRMLVRDVLRHVFDEQPLRDGRFFYRLL